MSPTCQITPSLNVVSSSPAAMERKRKGEKLYSGCTAGAVLSLQMDGLYNKGQDILHNDRDCDNLVQYYMAGLVCSGLWPEGTFAPAQGTFAQTQ